MLELQHEHTLVYNVLPTTGLSLAYNSAPRFNSSIDVQQALPIDIFCFKIVPCTLLFQTYIAFTVHILRLLNFQISRFPPKFQQHPYISQNKSISSLKMGEIRDLANNQLSGPAVFLFGPLALSFNSDSFAQLRKTIVENEDHRWALDTIISLPQYWKTIVAAIPELEAETESEKLEDLKEAFSTGQSLKTQFPLPNALLIPLVISLHLTQYASFIKHNNAGLDSSIDLFALSKDGQEALGLCTGLLSSLAVSSAGNKAEFLKYAAVAIRLGLLIGMMVDSQDEATDLGPSKSLTAAWNSAEKAEETQRILKDFPHVSEPLSNTFLLSLTSPDIRVRQLR